MHQDKVCKSKMSTDSNNNEMEDVEMHDCT